MPWQTTGCYGVAKAMGTVLEMALFKAESSSEDSDVHNLSREKGFGEEQEKETLTRGGAILCAFPMNDT